MEEKIIKYLLKEIIHTQIHLLVSDTFNSIKRQNPDLDDEVIRGQIDQNLILQKVEDGMKARAAHEGVELGGLLD